jgi:phosphoribosylamine--glycine ligase
MILKTGDLGFPVVVKADGLAGGKGVVICQNPKKAEEAASEMMVQKKFGAAGKRVLIEEFLRGREVSFIVISDGARVRPLVTVMDHKAVYDGGKGPNTGGMGAISPSPHMNEKLYSDIMETIVFPTITRMLEEGRKYKGVLYCGLMLTEDGPKVLEYNCRFGDPETQPQMLRLESDLVEIMLSAIEEEVLRGEVRWSLKPSACVVLASGGYPRKYENGKEITGLGEVETIPGVVLFHAGTEVVDGKYRTKGGRVLDVCASEATLEETMTKIYSAIGKIYFEAMHFRRDIGAEREV